MHFVYVLLCMYSVCVSFFSSFDILSNCCSVAMGGQLDRHILLLWQPVIVLLLLCYAMLSWFGK